MIDILLLDPIKALIALVGTLLIIDLILRLIPTKKSVSCLSLLARLLSKVAVTLKKISNLLPENRRLK